MPDQYKHLISTKVSSFFYIITPTILLFNCFGGHGCLNELGGWITQQLIQAYHQYGVGSCPALQSHWTLTKVLLFMFHT
jgi:hypothetical protein